MNYMPLKINYLVAMVGGSGNTFRLLEGVNGDDLVI
jgi:hypothetical protein